MISPRPVVVDATPLDMIKGYGVEINGPYVAKAIHKGDLVAGIGGLVEVEPGTWFAFLGIPAHERKPSMLRHILACFESAKAQGARTVRAFCDTSIPGAEKLMLRLGFKPTEEIIDDRTVWVWLISD